MADINRSIKALTRQLLDDTENDQDSSDDKDDSSGGNRKNSALTRQPTKVRKGKGRK